MFLDFNKKNIKFNLVQSNFCPIFTKSETRYLIDKYFTNSFNSQSVRLENIEINKNLDLITLNFSKTDFYSLLTSNIIYRKDIHEEDEKIAQIFKTVKREIKEELGIVIENENIILEGIFIGSYKLQPVVICSVKLNKDFNRLKLYGADTEFEVDEIYVVTDEELQDYLEYPMTEASRFQIKKILNLL